MRDDPAREMVVLIDEVKLILLEGKFLLCTFGLPFIFFATMRVHRLLINIK